MCSEAFNSPFAGVGVFVNAGSRNENLDTTGVAYLHERSVLNGTNTRTGAQLSADIAESGGSYDSATGREISHHTLKVLSDQVPRAVEILGGIVSNTNVNENALEADREAVRLVHEANHTEHEHITLENVHFNAFREHMIGQPVRGDRDNLSNLTAEDVHNYHAQNYYGDNLVVVGTGNHDHNELVDLVEQHFSNVPKTSDTLQGANTERPIYIPALLFIRDDEMYNSNVGVFYDAPGVKHQDYWGFQLLQRMFGDYRIDKHAGHINFSQKQYNSMHTVLIELPDVTRSRCHHLAYSDAGLFGNWFFGNEVFSRQMAWLGMHGPTTYGQLVN